VSANPPTTTLSIALSCIATNVVVLDAGCDTVDSAAPGAFLAEDDDATERMVEDDDSVTVVAHTITRNVEETAASNTGYFFDEVDELDLTGEMSRILNDVEDDSDSDIDSEPALAVDPPVPTTRIPMPIEMPSMKSTGNDRMLVSLDEGFHRIDAHLLLPSAATTAATSTIANCALIPSMGLGIHRLYRYVLLSVFSFLTLAEFSVCARMCRRWRDEVDGPWQHKFDLEYVYTRRNERHRLLDMCASPSGGVVRRHVSRRSIYGDYPTDEAMTAFLASGNTLQQVFVPELTNVQFSIDYQDARIRDVHPPIDWRPIEQMMQGLALAEGLLHLNLSSNHTHWDSNVPHIAAPLSAIQPLQHHRWLISLELPFGLPMCAAAIQVLRSSPCLRFLSLESFALGSDELTLYTADATDVTPSNHAQLEVFNFQHTAITPTIIECIVRMSGLKRLMLTRRLHNIDMSFILQLRNLEYLSLNFHHSTETSLASLVGVLTHAECPQLTLLDLSHFLLTDAHVHRILACQTRVTTLRLRFMELRSLAWLSHLAADALEHFELEYCGGIPPTELHHIDRFIKMLVLRIVASFIPPIEATIIAEYIPPSDACMPGSSRLPLLLRGRSYIQLLAPYEM
jgi:hypothetical protein